MNQINSIYTTVSGGKVHIAADTRYVGSVDSYNNCFTQFFAWIFNYSMPVNFDGKVHSVNKESYRNLVCSLTQNDAIIDIRNRSIFRSVAEKATLPTGNLRMRDVIQKEDRQALFEKLSNAISQGDTTKALLMIGKGAELDKTYYDRDRLCPSFSQDTSDLSSSSRYTFTAFKAAPILQAARKGNAVVCKFLKDAGANLSAVGEEYTFKREITSVKNHLEPTFVPFLVPHYHHTQDLDGHKHVEVRYETKYQVHLSNRTIVTTRDSRSNRKKYQLNPADLLTLYAK